MSIFIKGKQFKKPKNCGECIFYKEHQVVSNDIYKGTMTITNFYTDCMGDRTGLFGEGSTYIRDDCPIIEVEIPHGDLFDKEELKEYLRDYGDFLGRRFISEKDIKENIHVVIEAEEKS